MRSRRNIFIVLALLILSVRIDAQDSVTLKKFINNSSFSTYRLQYPKQVKEFYNYTGFQYSWLKNGGSKNFELLSNYLQHSAALGLQKEDYQPALFKTVFNNSFFANNEQDSSLAEVKFTDAAIHFIHDILIGNRNVSLAYNGLNYTPSCYDIPAILKNYLNNNRFENLVADLEPSEAGYLAIKKKLNFFQQKISSADFTDIVVKPSKKILNHTLIKRLYQLGFISSDTSVLSEYILTQKIKEAQNSFNLSEDGIAGRATLQALNVPLKKRAGELAQAINTLRWLTCIRQGNHTIVVNIPSATLLLYDHKKIVLESRIIVGRPSTPTPTLCSKITEVILYPYWNVTHNIATRELLPIIKRDPSYLESNNYQVLNKNGKVVNPSSINWSSLSRNYFPYVLRQSTGCDNSLGLIKLNFYNPFTVYLHDTPAKSLFDLNQRYFSHGCMRLQKAEEVGHFVLKNNTIAIDTLTEKGCLKNQSPITVAATEAIPIFVLYQTAWIDSAGAVKFYKDIYAKFSSK